MVETLCLQSEHLARRPGCAGQPKRGGQGWQKMAIDSTSSKAQLRLRDHRIGVFLPVSGPFLLCVASKVSRVRYCPKADIDWQPVAWEVLSSKLFGYQLG